MKWEFKEAYSFIPLATFEMPLFIRMPRPVIKLLELAATMLVLYVRLPSFLILLTLIKDIFQGDSDALQSIMDDISKIKGPSSTTFHPPTKKRPSSPDEEGNDDTQLESKRNKTASVPSTNIQMYTIISQEDVNAYGNE
jgi:hypothetical protein